MPPKKTRPAKIEPANPEEAWFTAMEAILLKIEELKQLGKNIAEQMSNISERRRDHSVGYGNASNRVREVGLGLSKDELKILLRSMRAHERWSEHYRIKYDALNRKSELNGLAINMLHQQLSQTPYPGEQPLIESDDVDE
jgi:hypothetical protein